MLIKNASQVIPKITFNDIFFSDNAYYIGLKSMLIHCKSGLLEGKRGLHLICTFYFGSNIYNAKCYMNIY